MQDNIVFELTTAKIPEDSSSCRVTCYIDGTMELRTSDKSLANPLPYRKISGDMLVNTNTGEVIFTSKAKNRAGSQDSARKSRRQVRALILNNFRGNGVDLHAVATFGEPVYDLSVVVSHHKKFVERLRYAYPMVEYLMVAEPHRSGAWHCHYFFKNRDGSTVFLSSSELEDIWKHGYVKVRRIQDVGPVAGYFTKQEKIELFHFYPPYSHLYHRSEGIVKPRSFRTSYGHAKELVENHQLVYSHTTHVLAVQEGGKKQELNAHTHETWTRKAVKTV